MTGRWVANQDLLDYYGIGDGEPGMTWVDGNGPPRPPTAVGAPAFGPDFDELFAYIDGLTQRELHDLTRRLRYRVPKWAWRGIGNLR